MAVPFPPTPTLLMDVSGVGPTWWFWLPCFLVLACFPLPEFPAFPSVILLTNFFYAYISWSQLLLLTKNPKQSQTIQPSSLFNGEMRLEPTVSVTKGNVESAVDNRLEQWKLD